MRKFGSRRYLYTFAVPSLNLPKVIVSNSTQVNKPCNSRSERLIRHRKKTTKKSIDKKQICIRKSEIDIKCIYPY